MEFGMHALCREEAWFCFLTHFSNDIATVASGMSQVFAEAMNIFFEPSGFNLHEGGISLPFAGTTRRIWAGLGVIIQDGAAHKSTWCSRGDGASKLCLLCQNIFTDASEMVDSDGAHLLRCNVVHERDLVAATDADLRNVARYLEASFAIMGPGVNFRELEQALGQSHSPHGILLHRGLDHLVKPCTQYMHDWMHTLFSDGIYNMVVYLIFEALIATGCVDIYEVFK